MNYYIIYKPYKIISQFTSSHRKKKCLGELGFAFPSDVYPVGRLDENSEGLLLLTNDKSLNFKLLNPANGHRRVYRVQVQGTVTNKALREMEAGVTIALKSGPYLTRPAKAKKISPPQNLAPRKHPVSDRLPSTWIELTLIEGKFHQVRKMTAGVGYPCLRLIRVAIEELRLENMLPGDVRELTKDAVYSKLHLKSE